jgi:hypothetical protein
MEKPSLLNKINQLTILLLLNNKQLLLKKKVDMERLSLLNKISLDIILLPKMFKLLNTVNKNKVTELVRHLLEEQ